MAPALQEGQDHDSKAVTVEIVGLAAVHTCIAEACAGVASVVVNSLGPREQYMMMVRYVARSSRPTFAMDTRMSDLMNRSFGKQSHLKHCGVDNVIQQ